MSILQLDTDENNASSILERTGLINEDDTTKDPFVDELKKSIQETTADMPLGKALHLLLNVHGQVFDKAVSSIQKSATAAEIAIRTAESPTIKAVLSIQNYISKDASALFKQIYDSLKDKFLKKQPNEAAMRIISYFTLHSSTTCKIQAQQVLIDELKSADKKDQLAAVVLLQFLMKHYGHSMNSMASAFFAPLSQLVEMRSSQPTLLNCLACELALQCIQMALTATPDTSASVIPSTKIMEVEETTPVENTSEDMWRGLDTLLYVLEKWQKSKSSLESAAYKELHQLVQDQDAAAWKTLIKYITPKSILSDKPLTTKKQKQILSNAEMSSSTQLLILTLLQKGQWIELYGDNRGTVITSTEQDDIKCIIQEKFESSMQLKHLVPQLVMALPRLFSCAHITDSEMIQRIVDQVVDYSDKVISRLTPMLMNQPEPSICYLLMHIAQQDTHSQFAYDMLTHLIDSQTEPTVAILQDNLLSLVKQSNQACELLIKCMNFADLPVLIRKLMKMSTVEDERERMTCIALISKALLQERWASSSILNYIEMVRDFKRLRGFTMPHSTRRLQGPQDIVSLNIPATAVEESEVFEPDQVQALSTSLLLPLQLWSTRVSEHDFGSALRQLVQYCCGIPKDGTWIDAWKQLSFAFVKNHQLVWPVVEECTHILTSQISHQHYAGRGPGHLHPDRTVERKHRVSEDQPHVDTAEAFDVLLLPSSYVNLIARKLEKIGVSRDAVKTSQQQDAHTPVCIQLMDELLQRSFEEDQLDQDIQNPVDFSTSLLVKLFCV
ncbi:hypothetical protein MBANPS3_005703 [Mucor bainieri]